MISPRTIFFSLLFAFVLLFAQQAGAAHALHHVLEDLTQQGDKQVPHSDACEKCDDYAQLGSALNVAVHGFTLLSLTDETVQHRVIAFRSIRILAAAARAPPYFA